MAANAQSYENHAKMPAPLIVHAALLLVMAGLAVAGLLLPETQAGYCCIGTAALVTPLILIHALMRVRRQDLILQDRIIQLEMRVRLARLLPNELCAELDSLTLQQLIALRFAGDNELPELVDKVLHQGLTGPDAIKQAIADWQPDHQRV
ncbi:MAG: DUF6526 family protein [Candidatus Hydrogenedentota bacterium]